MMTELRTLTDDELLRVTAAARRAAHDAPKAMGNGSRAWADRANDWMRLAAEVDRRGLLAVYLACLGAAVYWWPNL
jgi:dihydrodipicolinate synthase/N-acetylneuraminate lyase